MTLKITKGVDSRLKTPKDQLDYYKAALVECSNTSLFVARKALANLCHDANRAEELEKENAELKAWKESCFVQGDAKWELLKERDALKNAIADLRAKLDEVNDVLLRISNVSMYEIQEDGGPPIMTPAGLALLEEVDVAIRAKLAEPIPMVLHCPVCHDQHIDAPEPGNGWNNPPHKSHLCHTCGTIWRPASVPTTGVVNVSMGSKDNWPYSVIRTHKEQEKKP